MSHISLQRQKLMATHSALGGIVVGGAQTPNADLPKNASLYLDVSTAGPDLPINVTRMEATTETF